MEIPDSGNWFEVEISGLRVNGEWERSEAEALDLADLIQLKSLIDAFCDVLETKIELANDRISQGEAIDPTWIIRLRGKWRHMKRKRLMLQELVAERRRQEKNALRMKRIEAGAAARNAFLESFYEQAKLTLPDGVIKKLIALSNQGE